MSDKWAAISKEVAVALWGAPNARLSRGDRWRWGNKGSKSLDADKGLWKDFEADTGGGVLELVEIECQTDRRGAIQWLKDNGYWIESSPRHNVGRFQRQSARPVNAPQGRIVNARHISQSLSQRKAAHKTLRVSYGENPNQYRPLIPNIRFGVGQQRAISRAFYIPIARFLVVSVGIVAGR